MSALPITYLSIPESSKQQFTVEEYLALERDSEEKHEYIDGKIITMAGATPTHTRIVRNLVIKLEPLIDEKGCEGYMLDLRVKSTLRNQYTYPDYVAVCGEQEYEVIQGLETLTNPTLIVEVLSPSTENMDRTQKWLNYQRMPTLQNYVIIWQETPRIEQFYRVQTGNWGYSIVEGMENTLFIENFALSLPFSEIYAQVIFPKTNSDSDDVSA